MTLESKLDLLMNDIENAIWERKHKEAMEETKRLLLDFMKEQDDEIKKLTQGTQRMRQI